MFFFLNFFNHKLSPFRRWCMNVVNCFEIFCMHYFVFLAELKTYKYYFLDVWRNHNFLGQQRSLNSINKPNVEFISQASNFSLVAKFLVHLKLIPSRCVTYLFVSLTDFRWFFQNQSLFDEVQGITLNYCFDGC